MYNEIGVSDSDESIEQLLERIRPLMEQINLSTDITERLRGAINFGELSGTKLPDEAIRILILKERKILNNEQTRLIMKTL